MHAESEVALTEQDLKDLKQARELLESSNLAIRIANAIGAPVEKSLELLPGPVARPVQIATKTALEKALEVALMTMKDEHTPSSPKRHKAGAVILGGVGGLFGTASLAVELPLSTALMFRAIADIAREEGESIRDGETMAACLSVFALGGRAKADDSSETGYYAVRAALAKSVTEAAEYIARKKVIDSGAPALARLLAAVGARFGVVVSEKIAAAAIPIAGAAGGATVNAVFVSHFQNMARGHFTVRRLERIHGAEAVKLAYEKI